MRTMHLHIKQYVIDLFLAIGAGITVVHIKEWIGLATAGIIFITAFVRFIKEIKKKN